MSERHNDGPPPEQEPNPLAEMLTEIRILQFGAQLLTAFLVSVPFTAAFGKLQASERWLYFATFASSMTSLMLFAAPAAQHRLMRPLRDKEAFKNAMTSYITAAIFFLTLALLMVTFLVVTEAISRTAAAFLTAALSVLVGLIWWVVPLRNRGE